MNAAPRMLRDLRWAWLWVALWALMIGAVIAGSLLPPPEQLPLIRNGDKLLHGLAYALLMAWAVQLFAGTRAQSVCAVGLIGLGVALEVAQGHTATRSTDSWDVLANSVGVLLGLATAATPLAHGLVRVERRWLRR